MTLVYQYGESRFLIGYIMLSYRLFLLVSEGTPMTPQRLRQARLWRAWEDELASDYTKSAYQIGLMLGRTASAVTNRRRVLLTQRKTRDSENQR